MISLGSSGSFWAYFKCWVVFFFVQNKDILGHISFTHMHNLTTTVKHPTRLLIKYLPAVPYIGI